MGAIVTGNVQIGIRIDGSGDGTAKTKAAAKAVNDLKKEVGAAGAEAVSLRDKFKPLDGVRGTFENLRSNILAFPAAIATAVTGFIGLVGAIADAGSAGERLREMADEYREAVEGLKKTNEDLRKTLGQPLPGGSKFFGADVGDQAALVADKILTLEERIRDLKSAGETLAGSLLGGDELYRQTKQAENELRDLRREQAENERLSAEYMERQLRALQGMLSVAGLGWMSPGGMATGTAKQGVIDLDAIGGPTVVGPRRRGGGGGGGLSADAWWDDKRARFGPGRGAANDEFRLGELAALERTIHDAAGVLLERQVGDGSGVDAPDKSGRDRKLQSLAYDIRDVTAALSEALPGMGEFSAALSQIASIWSQWGGAAGDTKDAVVGSLGAIAKAGAQQIKDERLRAGVLSIIELGLGFANLANPPIAAGHFTAAAVLGSVALFGGGSGSGRSSAGGSAGGGQQRPVRVSSGEQLGQRAVQVTIQNYYGGRSEQEAGADFAGLLRRAQGSGFERGRDAA